mgnify:CR=1 FL=1
MNMAKTAPASTVGQWPDVQAVCQVDRVGRGHHDEDAEGKIEDAEIGRPALGKGDIELRRVGRIRLKEPHGHGGHDDEPQHLGLGEMPLF